VSLDIKIPKKGKGIGRKSRFTSRMKSADERKGQRQATGIGVGSVFPVAMRREAAENSKKPSRGTSQEIIVF